VSEPTANIAPLVLPSRQEAVYERLRELIRRGELRRLEEARGSLHLQALAEILGVSTMPIREAARRLEAEGLLVWTSSGLTTARLEADSVREIADIRIRLETLALERSIERMTAPAQAQIEQLAEQLEVVRDPSEWRALNREFHAATYAMCDYERLLRLVENLWVLIEPYLLIYTSTLRNLSEAQEDHRKLVQAIQAADLDEAARVLEAHIRHAEAALLRDPDFLAVATPSA
jgi:DNA-binding GntR family transcriptional regulator